MIRISVVLPAPFGPEETDDATGGDVQVDIVEHLPSVEPLASTQDGQRGRYRTRSRHDPGCITSCGRVRRAIGSLMTSSIRRGSVES